MNPYRQFARSRAWSRLPFGLIARSPGEGMFWTWRGLCAEMVRRGFHTYAVSP